MVCITLWTAAADVGGVGGPVPGGGAPARARTAGKGCVLVTDAAALIPKLIVRADGPATATPLLHEHRDVRPGQLASVFSLFRAAADAHGDVSVLAQADAATVEAMMSTFHSGREAA